jgi:integrase/recombinase XerD
VIAWARRVSSQPGKKGPIASSTAKRYGVSLLQCESHLASYDIDKIDGKVISSLVAERLKIASIATVRRDLTAISQVLDYAISQEWCEGNPALEKQRQRFMKERRDPIVLPDHGEIEAVIAASRPCIGALIRAAWLTGCRQAELVNATWNAFNKKAGTLEVTGKGNKRRTIQLSSQALSHFLAQPVTLRSELIFCNENGSRFVSVSSRFGARRKATAKKRKKFLGFRFHDLRHLFAVEALRGGMSVYRLSKHLGHTSVKTTEIYLTFLTPEEAERAKETSVNVTQFPIIAVNETRD